MVVASFERHTRDTARTAEVVAKTEAELYKLEWRVRGGELVDPAKIGRAAQRILGPCGISRLFEIEIDRGHFLYHYNEAAFDCEQLLAGRYVLVTSLPREHASTDQVVRAYRQLQAVENRFRVLKDFLHLRPARHFSERRVRGHITTCVYASVIEALISRALTDADVRDPDLADQHLTSPRALRELDRLRAVTLTAGPHTVNLVTRPDPLQRAILTALHVETSGWDSAHIR